MKSSDLYHISTREDASYISEELALFVSCRNMQTTQCSKPEILIIIFEYAFLAYLREYQCSGPIYYVYVQYMQKFLQNIKSSFKKRKAVAQQFKGLNNHIA
jgi:hypothetical protein